MGFVKVVHGDTRTTPFAMMGTGGSKAATMASGAVLHATRALKRKVLSLAAAMLEANLDDLDISEASVHVAGVSAAQLTIEEIARKAHFAPHELPAGEDLLLSQPHPTMAGSGDGLVRRTFALWRPICRPVESASFVTSSWRTAEGW